MIRRKVLIATDHKGTEIVLERQTGGFVKAHGWPLTHYGVLMYDQVVQTMRTDWKAAQELLQIAGFNVKMEDEV